MSTLLKTKTKIIELQISPSKVYITGRRNGQAIGKEQIVPNIKKDDLPLIIKFPDHILFVGSSYVEGIEDELIKVFSEKDIRENVGYDCKDETVRKDILR